MCCDCVVLGAVFVCCGLCFLYLFVPDCKRHDLMFGFARTYMFVFALCQVLVVDDDGLAGIFTEKDLLNRVLAKGRSPDTVVVADVMTPNPDTVSSSMTVLEALQEVRRLGLLGWFAGEERGSF